MSASRERQRQRQTRDHRERLSLLLLLLLLLQTRCKHQQTAACGLARCWHRHSSQLGAIRKRDIRSQSQKTVTLSLSLTLLRIIRDANSPPATAEKEPLSSSRHRRSAPGLPPPIKRKKSPQFHVAPLVGWLVRSATSEAMDGEREERTTRRMR